jgi:MFS family permease
MNNKSKSLYYSFLDGIFASIMTGFTMNYVVPFGLVLGAKNFHVALLNALPQLFSSIVQLRTAEMVDKLKSRLKIITLFVFLHGISYLLIILLLFVPVEVRILWFIFLTTLSSVLTSIAAPAWWSLMSDTVDKDKYGEYFAWRGKILGFVSLVSSFIAGWFLGVIKDKFTGFVILFFSAGISRLISGYFISKMEDIETKISPEKAFSYIEFIKRGQESNFVKYVFFVSLFNFAVFISAPFFSVYMLRELKMTYLEYTIVTLSTALAGLLFLPFWGKTADKIGNVKVIKVTGLLICILPILWIFSKNFFYLILINGFAGYIWAGFNLSTVNFIFDVASQETRTRCVGYFNFTNGMFIFLGTMLSGWLATHLPALVDESKLLTLFLLSGILRTVIIFVFKDKFYEVKKVEYVETKDFLLTVLGVKPVLDFSKDLFYPLFHRLNKE